MPLMTGPSAAEKVGNRCAWVANNEPHDYPLTYCGASSAYVMVSSVNGHSFYACVEHMAAERIRTPESILRVQTYRARSAHMQPDQE